MVIYRRRQHLISTFNADIEEIAKDLITIYKLKYDASVPELSKPLLRWFDFTIRYIDPKPRDILFSQKFPKTLDSDTADALSTLETLIREGKDVNKFQSKGLIIKNDTSGSNKQQRTDFLWADWSIHHLHLTKQPNKPGEYFSERSNWLLFCIFGSDFSGFIDVRNHKDTDLFSDHELFNIIIQSWPNMMEPYKIKGVAAAYIA